MEQIQPTTHQALEDLVQNEEYHQWRAQFPVGYLLAKKMEENKTKIIGQYDKEIYEYESKHIADPADYVGTRPDNQIRWKVL